MLIRKLKLAGFKSFVEPAELRIEPGLTGVVGPNGCGKSNLLEGDPLGHGRDFGEVDALGREWTT
jgi:recombinational DNA repair ATPase RecF